MSRPDHWNTIYATKPDEQLSWTQPEPRLSLELVASVLPGGRVIDVGGGASPLGASLAERGYVVTVLDVSAAAIERAKSKLGARAAEIRWVVADITRAPADLGEFDMWHDRAAFHFLTDPADRAAYRATLERCLPPGGHAVIATFAEDGPEQCSGLPVRRYDAPSLAAELGERFELLRTDRETHRTPWGREQAFRYGLFRRVR